MKPYFILECDNLNVISDDIYDFIKNSTDLLETQKSGWHFLDHKQLLRSTPELVKFFAKYKMVPNSASVVILYETGQLPLHVDELPVVAKVNIPVRNTTGWTTKWFAISEADLNNCPKTVNQFGHEIESLSSLPQTAFTFLDELRDHVNSPVVFNSRIPHEVIRINGDAPRIIASFTFFNEPGELLE